MHLLTGQAPKGEYTASSQLSSMLFLGRIILW